MALQVFSLKLIHRVKSFIDVNKKLNDASCVEIFVTERLKRYAKSRVIKSTASFKK